MSWRRLKFPNKMKKLSEVKFSDNKIDDKLRLNTLRQIAKLDVRVRYSFIKNENIPLDFYSKNGLLSGHLYTEIVTSVLQSYLPNSDKDFRVFCDNRNLKSLRRSEFKNIVLSKLLPKVTPNSIVQIEMLDSTSNANIQIADWICGALGRYYNKGRLGQECFDIIRNNLLSDGIELFKNYLPENQKNSIRGLSKLVKRRLK